MNFVNIYEKSSFNVHSLHLSVEQLLIFWNREIFCLIISAFKHHTNTECHFTSSTLSTKITSSTIQKHKNVAPAAVTPLNIFCRERLSHGEDKGRVAVLFYSMAADLAGPFPFPCCSIADPLNSHAGSSRLPPSPRFQLKEHLFSRRLLHSLYWKLRRKCFLQISFSQRHTAFADWSHFFG